MPDSAAALSVLVLAWDEAAPTVRAVVEAASTVGSLLVLLPPALPEPVPTPLMPAAPAAKAAPAEPAGPVPAPPAAPPLPPPAPAPSPLTAATTTAVTAPAVLAPQSAQPAALTMPALAGGPVEAAAPVVRVVHVVASQLPATVRSGTFQVPAAPYLGATAPVAFPELAAVPGSSAPNQATALVLGVAPAPAEGQAVAVPLQPSEAPTTGPAPATAAEVASPSAPAEIIAPAAGATVPAAAPATASSTPPEPLAEAAFATTEILDPDPEEELQPASQPLPTADTPANALQLGESASSSSLPALGPFGNRLPQFDTSAPPAPLATGRAAVADDPEDTPEERARVFAASVAAARQYTAPDLNSQVIRYARLAVPMALAGGPYEVIYAPAWPTWLAALELRQRTLGPLVLHLPALAAGRQPADTAAGWPAELQRQVLRQADLVLVETYALARRLRRELGLGPATVRVVPTADAAAVARALRRARRRPGLA